MKKHILKSLPIVFVLALAFTYVSCNDEWTEELYEHYISFRAPLDDNGVTAVYVPYSRHADDGSYLYGEGLSNYLLPTIVSGSTTNAKDIEVHVTHSDTLRDLNYQRFQNRQELYYVDMSDYAKYPATTTIKAGEDVSLLDIRFDFKGIDMSKKWVLPIEVEKSDSYGYKPHPRKHYSKAMLRIYPYNNYSGNYAATTLKLANGYDTSEAIGMETSRAYVVDENTVFFYAGNIDETRTDRALYKCLRASARAIRAPLSCGPRIPTCSSGPTASLRSASTTASMRCSPIWFITTSSSTTSATPSSTTRRW